jgi:hypothetical protein
MFNSINRKVVLPVIVSALMLVACDKSDDAQGEASVLSSNDTILRYVPADTPYVFANVAPLPDELLDKIEPKIEPLLQSYQTVLREVMAAKRQELSEEERNSDEAQQMTAIADELTTLLSIDGLRAAGLGRDATGAIYGNGLLPVIRIELTDGALFDDAISRLEEKAGQKLPVAEVGDHSYRYFDAGKIRIVIAVMDKQAVLTVVPVSFDDAQTSQALGLTLPARSIADSGVLQDIASDYGFTDHYVGFLDLTAIAEAFVGAASGTNAVLMALMDHESADLSDECRAEILSLAATAPRMVLGYTHVGVDHLDTTAVVELRDDIAAGLQALPAVVPGLGGDKGGLMSFGMSIDVKAARDFVEARIAAMEAEPFECEHFAGLQAAVAGGRVALSQPVPPIIYNFKGFLAVIDDIQGLDVATQTPPTSVDGRFLLAMDNVQALVSLGTMFSPELAALNLQTDGEPVALDLPQMQALGMTAYAALTDNALAIAVGDDAAAELEKMLTADAVEPPVFFTFSMDAARYYAFLGDAIAAGKQDTDDAASPEMQAALKDIMQAISDLYDRMTTDIRFTARGVEIESSVTLSD